MNICEPDTSPSLKTITWWERRETLCKCLAQLAHNTVKEWAKYKQVHHCNIWAQWKNDIMASNVNIMICASYAMTGDASHKPLPANTSYYDVKWQVTLNPPLFWLYQQQHLEHMGMCTSALQYFTVPEVCKRNNTSTTLQWQLSLNIQTIS